ncbi:MAG TPA: class I SAM-dependent methyltransferase [Rhizomicrobium sp.]|nr:class I SAM-dependent methyltransferase [Rhizomicrobium sp.]
MATRAERLTYQAAQTARVAFYGAHYLATRFIIARDAFSALGDLQEKMPSLRSLLRAMQELFRQDWANVEKDLYPMPVDLTRDIARAMASVRFWADIPNVTRRQKVRGHSEAAVRGEGLPRYYRQNFHFQTDGYLSEHSAKLYDFQVESLFGGTADAMRRRAYVPLAEFIAKSRCPNTTLLDIGAGTGRFLAFVKSVQPELKTIALDLSEPYLARARASLARASNTEFIAGAAEHIPLPDQSVDMAVSIYLFHELPPKIRTQVAQEIARVLKPGGLFVLADTIQHGDLAAFDGLIDAFPRLLHEPYYSGFARCDLKAIFEPAGLKWESQDFAYLTKVSVFRKPARARRKRDG